MAPTRRPVSPSAHGDLRYPAPRGRQAARPSQPARRLLTAIAVPLLLAGLITAGTPGWGDYLIKRGDTLSAIAAKYHTTVSRLVQVNNLPGNGNVIVADTSLRVPGGGARAGSTSTRRHLVVRGDTLSGIAVRYGVSERALASANKIRSNNIVRLDTTLVIPGRTSGSGSSRTSHGSSNTFAGRTYASSVVNAASSNRHRLSHRRLPSRDSMRSIIAGKARANGVDPALALAVSYQESGWNQGVVSVANAVGAMQVIPATTDWISGVVGRRLDPLDPYDNATAGVVLLRILTRSTSSDREAVAGYYQGLRSVRQYGMFPDTRRYVANVMYLRSRFA